MPSTEPPVASCPAPPNYCLDRGRSSPSLVEEPKSHLDTLISYLVAAKRSLSSIYHVSRANEIVNTARTALEESVIVSARTGFLRRGQKNQIRLLYKVRTEIENISHRGRAEFASVLKELDAVDDRLRRTLDKLQQTVVHSSFRPEGEDSKSLHDFVDERGVDELQTVLKSSIDRINEAQAQLDKSSSAFDEELQSLQHALGRYRTAMELVSSRSSLSGSSPAASNPALASPSSIPAMLHSLESNAQEMADLLESLVHHFDRCVTAVKHTEGGGAAARSITGDMPDAFNVPLGKEIHEAAEINANDSVDPMTESDYQEMLGVLTRDAAEAEDVVLEIQERSNDMEAILESVLGHRDAVVAICNATTEIFGHLSSLASTRLPEFIAQAHSFTQTWNEEHERIRAGMADLSDLRSLYVGFLDAYDGLILEVARRRHMRQGVERVLRDTRAKLDQLHEEDVNAREAFRVEQGDYLPSDIWPGLGRGPMKVKFARLPGERLAQASGDNDQETEPTDAPIEDESPADDGDYIPDLPKHVVDEAIARLKARAKADPLG
ncbi:putative kinase activator [Talaromyces proteolyticus]|uniref:Autophagy-related protein 17 n=1 Tax=Talaromyces proteolyticus TaxID=1131652 RepID=A0AAD4KEQ5_9EURO|nr:putative kinase activator [Talaromyces proteolyticus]KAH8690180.1 putative kinase activator [Talaromyces proteolyticus]